MLLAIRDEVEPVLHDPAESYEASPPVEHLGLQVVVSAVPAFPSANRLSEKFTCLL